MRRGGVIGIAGFLLLLAVALLAYRNAQGVSPEELQHRCEASRPEWRSYQEDIKGQIGAAPAAKWQGSPIRAEHKGAKVRVTFLLDPPWAAYEASIPVLLRDPLGKTRLSSTCERDGPRRIYTFALTTDQAPGRLPWIEVRYPHHERRLALDAQGEWEAP